MPNSGFYQWFSRIKRFEIYYSLLCIQKHKRQWVLHLLSSVTNYIFFNFNRLRNRSPIFANYSRLNWIAPILYAFSINETSFPKPASNRGRSDLVPPCWKQPIRRTRSGLENQFSSLNIYIWENRNQHPAWADATIFITRNRIKIDSISSAWNNTHTADWRENKQVPRNGDTRYGRINIG